MIQRRFRKLAPDLVAVPASTALIGIAPEQAPAIAEQFGIPIERCLSETPQRYVELEAFEISRGPVSCAEYLAFVLATDHPTPPYWGGDEPPHELSDHPVAEVSYNDARAYCRWLGTATDHIFRLPSEAEWEHAARGNARRTFPWGDRWEPGGCNIAASATTPVGSYQRDTSPFGCVDMAGNVEEWTSSVYRPYTVPTAPADRNIIVVRGGSWRSDIAHARCTSRQARDARAADAARGFRVVRIDE